LAAGTKQAARALLGRIGNAIDRVAALGALLVQTDLAGPFQPSMDTPFLLRPARDTKQAQVLTMLRREGGATGSAMRNASEVTMAVVFTDRGEFEVAATGGLRVSPEMPRRSPAGR
jgi:hypothetical protein